MLVSQKYQFIVACPTKTGTNSLRAVAEKWKRSGGERHVLDLLTGESRTRHRIAPPAGMEHYRRGILYRPDEERLPSMYEYLRRKDWEWEANSIQFNEKHYGREEAWVRFLRVIAATRQLPGYFSDGMRYVHGSRPYMWTDLMDECVRYFLGVDAGGGKLSWWGSQHEPYRIYTSDFARDWYRFLSLVDVGGEDDALYDVPITQRNATPLGGRLFRDPAAYWKVPGASIMLGEIEAVAER